MPAQVKSPKQAKEEADARAVRRASTPLEYSAGIDGCIRLHSRDTQEDGSPEFNHEFFSKLNASANAKRKQEAAAADMAALAAPRNWVSVPELARLTGVHRSTIDRAIARKHLAASRTSVYGRYRVAWPDARAYLTSRCQRTSEDVQSIEQTWASTMEAH